MLGRQKRILDIQQGEKNESDNKISKTFDKETNLNFDFGVRRRFSMCQRRCVVLSVSNGAETSVGGK